MKYALARSCHMFGRFVLDSKTVTVKFGGQVEAVDVGTFTRVLLD